MKSYFRLLLAAFIISTFAFTVSNAQMMSSKINFSGHVFAGMENTPAMPVANATVSLQSFTMLGDTVFYQANTDTTGAFIIDSVQSGVYALTVNASGYQTLYIREFYVSAEHDSINLFLHVTLNINGGLVSGHIRFEMSEDAIVHSEVEFINLDNTKPNIFAVSGDEGTYFAKVPAGQYYVSCSISLHDSTYFFQEYWDNATTLTQAKVLTVADGQMYKGINFDIPDSVIAPTHSVTFEGKVESSMNMPVANAMVKVWASGEVDEDSRDNAGTAMTDSNGNYSITLSSLKPFTNTFIVSAHAEGYPVEFYNNQTSFFNATALYAFGDTTFTGINFTLTASDTVTHYSLSGTVMDSAGNGIKGAFVAVFDSASHHDEVHVGVTDSTGNYTVSNLAAGTYYVMFHAKGYISQFYMNAEKWENATPVHVSSTVTGINATLTKEPQIAASGEIIGQIHSSAGLALSGVLVTVFNSNNQAVASAVTDASGSFTILGIAQGSYTVTASLATYSSQQQTAAYNPNSGSTTVQNFTMPSSITAVSNPPAGNLPTMYKLDNNYPNPFNPSTVIGFTIPMTTHVRLDIYNILGQRIAELVNSNMAAGHYQVSFNASGFASGVYLYRLSTNNFTSVKKMILSK